MDMIPRADHSFITRKYLDVSYSRTSEAQKLDLYLPEGGAGPFPLIAFIHGGAFASCDKADCQVQPFLEGVKRGYAVASLDYRLSGEAVFPAGIHDVRAALRFLRANAAAYHIDPDHVFATGDSSGGNYTAMVCVLTGRRELDDPALGNVGFSSDVQAGVAWFPPTAFLLMDSQLHENGLGPEDHNAADSPESRYLGGQITKLDPGYVEQANPMTYVHQGMPPMLIQHGRRDHLVPWQQSKIFVEKIRSVCGADRVEFDILETADHADKQFESPENMEKVFAFLDRMAGV
ncbi:MAG: alpha/beta hydrolase [Treponema sp.]|jgi:acetyl esterase/lipase|nr:alpha/beta hydrolase [Treponema sp.]